MPSSNFLIPSPCQHLGPIYSTEITQHPLLHQNLGNPLPPPLIRRHLWMYPNTQCTLNQWQNFCTPGRSMSRTACYHKEEAWRTALQKGHHGRTDSSSPQWTASHTRTHTHTRPEICHTTKRRTKKRPKKLTQFVHKKPVCMQDIAVRTCLHGRNLSDKTRIRLQWKMSIEQMRLF